MNSILADIASGAEFDAQATTPKKHAPVPGRNPETQTHNHEARDCRIRHAPPHTSIGHSAERQHQPRQYRRACSACATPSASRRQNNNAHYQSPQCLSCHLHSARCRNRDVPVQPPARGQTVSFDAHRGMKQMAPGLVPTAGISQRAAATSCTSPACRYRRCRCRRRRCRRRRCRRRH